MRSNQWLRQHVINIYVVSCIYRNLIYTIHMQKVLILASGAMLTSVWSLSFNNQWGILKIWLVSSRFSLTFVRYSCSFKRCQFPTQMSMLFHRYLWKRPGQSTFFKVHIHALSFNVTSGRFALYTCNTSSQKFRNRCFPWSCLFVNKNQRIWRNTVTWIISYFYNQTGDRQVTLN
jgi:hypothetical protein